MNISQQKINSIITYLEILKEKANDDDTILSINEIKEDLTENIILSKSDILDELNHVMKLADSLREQMFVLSYNPNAMRVNTDVFTYAILDNLQYIVTQLKYLIDVIDEYSIYKKRSI